jgi:CheY-like chemotaxis protein
MPGEDGFSLVSRWRALGSRQARTPAIAVTAHAREQDRDRALSVGFWAHLAKPFEAQHLLDVAAGVPGRGDHRGGGAFRYGVTMPSTGGT